MVVACCNNVCAASAHTSGSERQSFEVAWTFAKLSPPRLESAAAYLRRPPANREDGDAAGDKERRGMRVRNAVLYSAMFGLRRELGGGRGRGIEATLFITLHSVQDAFHRASERERKKSFSFSCAAVNAEESVSPLISSFDARASLRDKMPLVKGIRFKKRVSE